MNYHNALTELSPLIDRLQAIKDTRNANDTALIQFKIDLKLRAKLLARLKSDKLTQKDLFISAIKIYMGEY